MPTAKDTLISRQRGSTTPPPAATFTPRIPEHAVEVVPGAVYLVRGWMPKKLADTVGVRLIEETYEMSLPQYKIGRKGVPVKDEDKRLARFGDPDLNIIVVKGKETPVLNWTDALLELKSVLQEELGVPFNCCGVNYLVGGKVQQDPHSDVASMPSIGDQPVIAHVGFGATRRYEFRSMSIPDKVMFSCEVNHGDLLLMVNRSQIDYLHGIPADPRIKGSRVHLAFRFHLPGFARATGTSGVRKISTKIPAAR